MSRRLSSLHGLRDLVGPGSAGAALILLAMGSLSDVAFPRVAAVCKLASISLGGGNMKLKLYKDRTFPRLGSAVAKSAHSVCLYYVYIGRNAWNSTWIRLHQNDCMHSTRESAEDYAECLREPGAVIYIQELPALVLRSEAGCIVVTEINTKFPLGNYFPFINLSRDGEHKGIHWLRRDNEKTIRSVVDSLQSHAWWDGADPSGDVFVLGTILPFESFVSIPGRPSRFRSISCGAGNRLAWVRDEANALNPTSVKYLARMFVGNGLVNISKEEAERWSQ